jgi:orotate phosphoribosyltransferase
MTEKERLLSILKELSYEEGEFTLRSGRKSPYYVDARQTTLNPEGMFLAGKILYELIRDLGHIEAVGGVSMGADPLVCATVMHAFWQDHRLFAFLIRKEPKGYGTSRWIEGTRNLRRGMNVVILEDVVTTGESAIRAAQIAEKEGLYVRGIVALLDRLEGARETIESSGYAFISVFTLTDLRSPHPASP